VNREQFKNLMENAGYTNKTLSIELNKSLNTVSRYGSDKNKNIPVEIIKFLESKIEIKKLKDDLYFYSKLEKDHFLKTKQIYVLENFISKFNLTNSLIEYLKDKNTMNEDLVKVAFSKRMTIIDEYIKPNIGNIGALDTGLID
jgi:hypothetical protein